MRLLIAVTTFASIVAISSDSHAGSAYEVGPVCQANSDGSGYCYGTLIGWRNATDPHAQAGFYYDGVPNGFFGYLNGKYNTCTAPHDGSLDTQFRVAMNTPNISFTVYWDSTGVCTNLYIDRASSWAN